jgi:hypothetical protein
VSVDTEALSPDLRHLESHWQGTLGEAYREHRRRWPPKLALAAALVETGITLHGLGRSVPSPLDLLLGDLCLARASRLLAHEAGRAVQIGFARAIEQAASAPAEGMAVPALRELLGRALEGTG